MRVAKFAVPVWHYGPHDYKVAPYNVPNSIALLKSRPPAKLFPAHYSVVLVSWLVWLGISLDGQLLTPQAGLPVMGAAGLVVLTCMLGSVFAVVRFADHLADLLGEPLGTLVLTLTATVIEVTLMVAMMLAGDQNPTLLRDTVFATLMLVLNGLVGTSLTAGGWRHLEQAFNLQGALSFLHLIAPLSLILLVLPDYSRSTAGPTLAPQQEALLGVACVSVYAVFLLMQTTRHRSYFDHAEDERTPSALPNALRRGAVLRSAAGLLFSVLPVVLLSEHLSGLIDYGIEELHAPASLGGLIVAALVLAPEGLGAYRAAIANRVQRAVNICLGSALSTIALTVPTMLIIASLQGHSLILGLQGVNSVLLYATLFVALITFVSGRATILQGQVHILLFSAYLFFIFFP